MKNRSLSLILVLSIALSGATPALNAMQTIKRGIAKAMPAWTKGPGFQAAKKWWKAGRNVNALTPAEQQAFNTLKKRVAIGAIVAALTTLLGAALTYYASKPSLTRRVEKIIDNLDIIDSNPPTSKQSQEAEAAVKRQVKEFKEKAPRLGEESKSDAVKRHVTDALETEGYSKSDIHAYLNAISQYLD